MALTRKRIIELRRTTGPAKGYTAWADTLGFAQAIEAEVRKADTELIRQMLEALEQSYATLWEEDDDPERPASAAITAARARLGGGIFAPENAHLFTQEAAAKAFAHVKPLGKS